ncbi:MAG: NADP-dependent oxidoreductase [Saprospiraceae bacterium]|nr:NADP-dependent oxidoreductase [Candidatus Parvibacillus calidus]WKZ64494.1 MAG: NADP-dependent oxidoreductase [Saprospiraceae bacterium]
MKAMIIKQYGSPDTFEWGDTNIPSIKENEMLVKVHGSSVNPVDTAIRKGMLKSFVRLNLPAVLGVDVSGEVVSTGSAINKFKIGDRVYAFMGIFKNGGYGEFVAVPESYAAKIPNNISTVDAGVIPGVGMTAYEAFTVQASLKKGMKVLINGAAGGVGTYAVQIAKALEADVTAVCSTSKTQLVKGLGANMTIDYTLTDLLSVPDKYDVILNCVRETPVFKIRKLLKPGGKLITITGNPIQVPLIKFLNFFSSMKIIVLMVKTDGKLLEGLSQLIEQNKVKIIIEKTYPIKNLAEAHRHVETGRTMGKVCIDVIGE